MEGGLALLERGVQRFGDEHGVVLFVGQQHFHFRMFQRGADAQVFAGNLRIALDALAQIGLHALHGAHQAAHFVLALHRDLVVELARGDRIGHLRGGLQRLHHLATQQREQRDAEHQRRAQADGKNGPQQAVRLLHDRGIRHHHAEGEALLRLADLQWHIRADCTIGVGGEIQCILAGLDRLQHCAVAGIGDLLADARGVVRGQHHARGRQQFDITVLHRAQGAQALLQCSQCHVHGHRAQILAVLQDRRGQGGHQHGLAADLVIVGFGHGLPQQGARFQIPVAQAGGFVVGEWLAYQGLVAASPVGHEAAGGIVALGIGESAVFAVEGLRLPQRTHAHPLGVILQLVMHHGRSTVAADAAIGALHQQCRGHGLTGGQRLAKVAADLLGLVARGILHRGLCRAAQRAAALPIGNGRGQTEAQRRNDRGTEHQAVRQASAET